MKKKFLSIFLMVFLFGTGICFAEAGIPNLVGAWTVQGEGAVVAKNVEPGALTHYSGDFSVLTAEAVITSQEGRVFHGIFTSPNATEHFAGVIGWDNKTFYCVDQDGTTDAMIVGNDNITYIYRHVGANDSVVAVGKWTRKK